MGSEKGNMTVGIKGMHCPACEILIEKEINKIKGVKTSKADLASGTAKIKYHKKPDFEEIVKAITKHGYSVLEPNEHLLSRKDYLEVILFFTITAGTYFILNKLSIFPDIGIKENMGLGFVFLIGLVAAVSSCLAVSGGLLLAVSARYSETHQNMTGWQKFKPNIYFNVGRIASYSLFGALIGAFGSVLSLSSSFNGWLTLFASMAMIVLGFQLIGIFPWIGKIIPKMPKFIGHKMNDSRKEHWATPFIFGAGTFFLPCGFTMALQFYVLSKADAFTGFMTMLVFSLGTLPSLASLGAITSYVSKKIQKSFMRFAGTVVILLGILSFPSAISLIGLNFDFSKDSNDAGLVVKNPYIAQQMKNQKFPAQQAEIINGKQIVKMKIEELSYVPSKFIIKQGIPVEWQIDSSKAAGCAQVIQSPGLGILEYLSPGKINVISFVPKEAGIFKFSCTMGMTTPGAAFNVV